MTAARHSFQPSRHCGIVLHQTLTVRALIGCVLILSGVLMVQLVPMMRRRKARALANTLPI